MGAAGAASGRAWRCGRGKAGDSLTVREYFHLFHGGGVGEGNAVTQIERRYPGRTFVVSGMGIFAQGERMLSEGPFVTWPGPSLVRTKGTRLGALTLDDFPGADHVDSDCEPHIGFPENEQRPMAAMADGLLYPGPQTLRLKEAMPADIGLDADCMTELRRRSSLTKLPEPGSGAGPAAICEFERSRSKPVGR